MSESGFQLGRARSLLTRSVNDRVCRREDRCDPLAFAGDQLRGRFGFG
jgi:hypothetical protein